MVLDLHPRGCMIGKLELVLCFGRWFIYREMETASAWQTKPFLRTIGELLVDLMRSRPPGLAGAVNVRATGVTVRR